MSKQEPGQQLHMLLTQLDPAHYYDPGEVAILRAYFKLKPSRTDPKLADLHEPPLPEWAIESDEETPITGPIRLRKVDCDGVVNELSNAVARICLSDVQARLPQWAAATSTGVLLARPRFEQPDREITPLNPQRLLCINWADSGPGYSWPEDYFVTLLPGFNRYVVTASADSTDSYGVTDFTIGWFNAREEIVVGGRRLLLRWWRCAHRRGQEAWEYLFDEGLIDTVGAYRMRAAVWPDETGGKR